MDTVILLLVLVGCLAYVWRTMGVENMPTMRRWGSPDTPKKFPRPGSIIECDDPGCIRIGNSGGSDAYLWLDVSGNLRFMDNAETQGI